MTTVLQPVCGHTGAQIETIQRQAKRGERSVTYVSLRWICPQCEDPTTGMTPFRFVDATLGAINQSSLAAAWLKEVGEPLPASPAAVRLRELGFSQEELVWIEQHRGEQSALAFVRGLVQQEQRKAS